ncbi:MAG: hypothetical protein E6J45_02365 [Chloroflexi bacterium]|nr:MAG: hypothetical protein E6J45_02365 [Chloroflexota bacterium]
MSTRSTRRGRGGARWPSSETCRRYAPVLFAGFGAALALALHVVTAEAAGSASVAGQAAAGGPWAGVLTAAPATTPEHSRRSDRRLRRDDRNRGRHHMAGTARSTTRARTGTARSQPLRGERAPAAPAESTVVSGVEAARSSALVPVTPPAQPAAAQPVAAEPAGPLPTPPAEIPPVIAPPLLTLPSAPRQQLFSPSWPGVPFNVASLAALVLAAAVAASALVLARRRT